MDSDFNLLTGLLRVYTMPTSKFFQNFLVGGTQVFFQGDSTFMIFDFGGQRK
jgi:hypothetical protein